MIASERKRMKVNRCCSAAPVWCALVLLLLNHMHSKLVFKEFITGNISGNENGLIHFDLF